MHPHPVRIYALLLHAATTAAATLALNPREIASLGAISNRTVACITICVERSPPFAVDEAHGADIHLIDALRRRLIAPRASQVRVLPTTAVATVVHRCDILFANAWPAAALIASDFYHVDAIVVCAAKRHNADEWRKLHTITTTQLAMVGPFMLYTAITYYLSRRLIHPDQFQNLYIISTAYFRILCSVPNSKRLLPTRLPLRILYTAWLFYCYVISINYSTLILRVFKKQLYSPQILNLMQAEQDQVELYTLSSFQSRMNYPRTMVCQTIEDCIGILKETEQRYKETSNQEYYFLDPPEKEAISQMGPAMIALPATFMRYHRKDFMFFGESTVHCFEHPSAYYKRRLLVREDLGQYFSLKSSQNMPFLNELLLHIRRSGLYEFWLRWTIRPSIQRQRNYYSDIGDVERSEGTTTNSSVVRHVLRTFLHRMFGDHSGPPDTSIGLLSFKDFVVLYAYLLIGVFISTLGFLAEYIYYYFKPY